MSNEDSFDQFMETDTPVEETPKQTSNATKKPKKQKKAEVAEVVAEVEEVEEVAEEDPKPTPVVKAKEDGLTNFQLKDLETLADKYETPFDEVLTEYNANVKDPAFQKVSDINQRFRMAKRLVENSLEKKAKLETRSIFLLGKSTRFISGEWNSCMSQAIGLIATAGKKPTITQVSSFENSGGKIYQSLWKATPLHSYNIHLTVNTKNAEDLRLTEQTVFKNGTSPVEANEEKYGDLTDMELFERFAGIKAFDSIEDAGLSDTDKNGYAINTDLKAVRVMVEKPSKTSKAKEEDFKNLFTWRASATDMKGNKIVLRLPSFPEYESLIPSNQKFVDGVAIGPISEYQDDSYMDVFHWIPSEDEE